MRGRTRRRVPSGIKNRSSTKRSGHGTFVCDCLVEMSLWFTSIFDTSNEAIQTPKAVYFVGVSKLCGIKCASQNPQRLIIGGKGHGKRMSIFAAMRKREAGGVRKAAGDSVNDLSNQSQCLERSRTEAFLQQKRCEIAQIAFVRDCEDRTESFQIDIGRSNFMVRGQG